MNKTTISRHSDMQLWGGVECTINRVGETWFNQMQRSGHETRADDIDRLCGLGLSAIRYPVLWERVAPNGLASADWRWPDAQLPRMRDAGIDVIAGLVHHGSGPAHTSLLDPGFAEGLAEYAGAVAARYPWFSAYTPVNEPLTTARFCGLYGLWYPHGRDDRVFVQALLNQCRAVVLAMRAIRAVNPQARLVQTDDFSRTSGTAAMADTIAFYNERRWLGWDLLCGKVGPDHPLWGYLLASGAAPEALLWLAENACPPDIVGVNYYVTSDRWLDHRGERYPAQLRGEIDGVPCVDIETVRAPEAPAIGIAPLLMEVWHRYRLPLAVTEAHIGARREDQLRWLHEIWQAAGQARAAGADVRAVTAWALLGSFDWNSLVTRDSGHYESGAFDVRSPSPRPTAVAGMLRELAAGAAPTHPALHGQGWWRHVHARAAPLSGTRPPILISGARGTLGQAFARICRERDLGFRLLTRQELDIADPASVARAIENYRPWAIINASGYVRVDEAEGDSERCFRENAIGPAILAAACARHGVHLTTFSSDLVFDGGLARPYRESDTVCPINVYGHSKAAAERSVREQHPGALVIRTSAFFGPWDPHNFVHHALDALHAGRPFGAAADLTVSPTYVPDLVHACLDLIIDGESGLWHLTNGDAVTWLEFARRAAERGGIDPRTLAAHEAGHQPAVAARPVYSALGSDRAILMPPLNDALDHFLGCRAERLRDGSDFCQPLHGDGLFHA